MCILSVLKRFTYLKYINSCCVYLLSLQSYHVTNVILLLAVLFNIFLRHTHFGAPIYRLLLVKAVMVCYCANAPLQLLNKRTRMSVVLLLWAVLKQPPLSSGLPLCTAQESHIHICVIEPSGVGQCPTACSAVSEDFCFHLPYPHLWQHISSTYWT